MAKTSMKRTPTAREQAPIEAIRGMIASRLAFEGLGADHADLLKLLSGRLFILSDGAGLPDGALDQSKRSAPGVAEPLHKHELSRQFRATEPDLHKPLSRMNARQTMA